MRVVKTKKQSQSREHFHLVEIRVTYTNKRGVGVENKTTPFS